MGFWSGLGIALAAAAVVYAALVVGLLVAGRATDARALARFIPDCVVLVARLRRAGDLGRMDRLLLLALVGYLALPFDLVPDVLPVIGQLDDAIVMALVLRAVARRVGPGRIAACWPGPEPSLRAVLRLAGAPVHA